LTKYRNTITVNFNTKVSKLIPEQTNQDNLCYAKACFFLLIHFFTQKRKLTLAIVQPASVNFLASPDNVSLDVITEGGVE